MFVCRCRVCAHAYYILLRVIVKGLVALYKKSVVEVFSSIVISYHAGF